MLTKTEIVYCLQLYGITEMKINSEPYAKVNQTQCLSFQKSLVQKTIEKWFGSDGLAKID